MVKLVNYSLMTALPTATSADPLFTRGLSESINQVNQWMKTW